MSSTWRTICAADVCFPDGSITSSLQWPWHLHYVRDVCSHVLTERNSNSRRCAEEGQCHKTSGARAVCSRLLSADRLPRTRGDAVTWYGRRRKEKREINQQTITGTRILWRLLFVWPVETLEDALFTVVIYDTDVCNGVYFLFAG